MNQPQLNSQNKVNSLSSSWVNLYWPVMGDRIPSDHNYRLYSALIGKIPQLKDIDWQLGTITGIPDHAGWVKLGGRSTLLIRCKFADLNLFSPLDSNIIRVGKTLIELGESEGESIQPAESLKSRVVTIKTVDCRTDPFAFGVSLGKQLSEMGVQSIPVMGDRVRRF